jgi:hypothetical protein
MSDTNAIAAVTATLRNLLTGVTGVLPDALITTKPPHKARADQDQGNQLNLFLYHIAPNAARRERSATSPAKGQPAPLALNLSYLITAYGRDHDEIFSHRLMGEAMSILHSHGVLSREEIRAALPGQDLGDSLEEVRIMPQTLSQEEVTRLWSTFQTPYCLSMLYQAAVVLIPARQTIPGG